MNKTQIAILGAFDATMQTFVNLWEQGDVDKKIIYVAYGGAAAMLTLVKNTTDINESANLAAALLNQAAEMLGLPQKN